jgi:hypothetical protein
VLRVDEVYLRTVKEYEESPDGSKKLTTRKEYGTRDCLLNPEYIVAVYDHAFVSSTDQAMLAGLPAEAKFCRVIVDGNSFRSSEIIIAHSFSKFESRLNLK